MTTDKHPPAGRRMLESSAVTGAMTFISRIFGLIRDNVIGQLFGAGAMTDAFLVAFRIPNLFRRLFAEGAFAQAFVPVFTEYRETRTHAELVDLERHVLGTLGGVLLLVTTLGAAGAPWLVVVVAPGFIDDPTRLSLASDMLRITFPYLFFISLVAAAGAMFNAHRRFAVAAFTPVLLNLALIAAALWLAPQLERPVVALAWGVLVAGVAQLLFQLPLLARLGLLAWPRFDWNHPGVVRVRTLMLPVLFASSVAQINLLIDTVIASFLVAGSVSWLYFSDRLVEFPLGVFGIALATVVLPHLSAQHATASGQAFDRTLDWALRLVALVAVPAMVGLAVLATPLIATIFQYGRFTGNDTALAAIALVAYATGLPAYILIKILAAGYFSRQDTRTPVRFALISLLANFVLNVVLVFGLVSAEATAPHVGLAVATSVAAWLHAALLLRGLRRTGVYTPRPGWPAHLMRVGAACVVMTIALWLLLPESALWNQWSALRRTTGLAALVAAGLLAYFATLALLRMPWRALRSPDDDAQA